MMGVRHNADQLAKESHSLGARNCSELSYRITVPKEVFNAKAFSDAVGPTGKSKGWNSVLRGPRDRAVTDYHLHIYWKPDGSEWKLQVDFHAWMSESQEKHGEPFAEDFFDWVSQFFTVDSVNAHIHGEFEYPVDRWQSRIFALPIKVPFEGKTAEIEGLSVKLPAEAHGIHDAWISRGKKKLDLQLYADRKVTFRNFTPHRDVDAFVSVAMSLIAEQK